MTAPTKSLGTIICALTNGSSTSWIVTGSGKSAGLSTVAVVPSVLLTW